MINPNEFGNEYQSEDQNSFDEQFLFENEEELSEWVFHKDEYNRDAYIGLGERGEF